MIDVRIYMVPWLKYWVFSVYWLSPTSNYLLKTKRYYIGANGVYQHETVDNS